MPFIFKVATAFNINPTHPIPPKKTLTHYPESSRLILQSPIHNPPTNFNISHLKPQQ